MISFPISHKFLFHGLLMRNSLSFGSVFHFHASLLCAMLVLHRALWYPSFSAPVDGEKSAQVRSLVELQAGKNAIDITGAISRTATDLMYHSSNLPG